MKSESEKLKRDVRVVDMGEKLDEWTLKFWKQRCNWSRRGKEKIVRWQQAKENKDKLDGEKRKTNYEEHRLSLE
jgi:hypothetical protein